MKRILFLTLFLAACGGGNESSTSSSIDYSQAGEVAQGDMFVTANIGGATNLVPWLAGEASSSEITQHIYESLLKYDKDLNIVGSLADSWDVSNDGKTITFNLRKDVTWHDGEKFDAHDVATTFNALIDPNTRTPYAGDFQMVENFDVLDDDTIRVTYPKAFAPALSSWVGLAILPEHILKLDEDVNETRLKNTAVGTGPYKLEKWDPQGDTVLVANPNYYKPRANLEKIRIRIIPDLDTQFLELKAGKLDSMALKPVQFTRLTSGDTFTKQYAKYAYLGFGYTYLGFNLKNPLFSDKRVRQALSYATPRQQLVDGILMGKGRAITGVFKPETWADNTHLNIHPYDLDKAKALLAEAGWTDSNGDGVLDKDGQPFQFTIITNQGNDQRIKTAEILQQNYGKIGIKITIQVQEWRTFLENTLYPRNFQAFILGWRLSPEPDPDDIWHSSKQGPQEFNVVGFENEEADRLMTEARHTFDQGKRKELLDRFQEILHEEQPTLLLYAPETLIALHKRIKNIHSAPAGISHNFEEWYVPTEQQKYKTDIVP